MRIIAGELGGRQFDSPKSASVHPMSEKVRGAIFNALGDISGLSVLDAYSGSGALALEAASRGASEVLAIEKDASAQKIIASNIRKLDLAANVKLVKASAGAWAITSEESFELILLDPPYDKLQPELLKSLATKAAPNGTVVLSLPPGADFSLAADFELLASKNYGDATLTFYRPSR